MFHRLEGMGSHSSEWHPPSSSQREPDARFRFSRMDHADVSGGPRTITRTVEQVLLDIAVGIDEGEEKMAHFEGASPWAPRGLRPPAS